MLVLGSLTNTCAKFMNPALYHLLQILGVHHGEIKRHLSLLQYLNTMVVSLHLEASAYSTKSQSSIFDLCAVVQGIHSHLAIVDLGLEVFNRPHVDEAMRHLSSKFKVQMTQVSDTVRASAACQTSLEDGRCPSLRLLCLSTTPGWQYPSWYRRPFWPQWSSWTAWTSWSIW